jgi:hypothetical protein
MDEEEIEPKETTIFLDRETKRKISFIARSYERSMAAQLRWWANRDYAELEQLKLKLPTAEIPEPEPKSIGG